MPRSSCRLTPSCKATMIWRALITIRLGSRDKSIRSWRKLSFHSRRVFTSSGGLGEERTSAPPRSATDHSRVGDQAVRNVKVSDRHPLYPRKGVTVLTPQGFQPILYQIFPPEPMAQTVEWRAVVGGHSGSGKENDNDHRSQSVLEIGSGWDQSSNGETRVKPREDSRSVRKWL